MGVAGGVAAVLYGDPRFTRDIDIVLQLRGEDSERLVGAFESADFYVPPLETLIEEAGRSKGGHFNIIHRDTGLRADVYLFGSEPLHQWGFAHRRRLELAGGAVSLAPMEYVILRKLQYYRASGSDRHLRDVSSMIRVSPEELDQDDLRGWVAELELEGEWAAAQRFEENLRPSPSRLHPARARCGSGLEGRVQAGERAAFRGVMAAPLIDPSHHRPRGPPAHDR